MVGQHVRGWWKYAHTNEDVSKIVLRPDVNDYQFAVEFEGVKDRKSSDN